MLIVQLGDDKDISPLSEYDRKVGKIKGKRTWFYKVNDMHLQ